MAALRRQSGGAVINREPSATKSEFFPEVFQVKLEKLDDQRSLEYILATEPDNTYSIDGQEPVPDPGYRDEVSVSGGLSGEGATAVHTLRDVSRSGKGTGPLVTTDITDNPRWSRRGANVFYRKGTAGEWLEVGYLNGGWVHISLDDIPEEDRRTADDGGGGGGGGCQSDADCPDGFACQDGVCVEKTGGGDLPIPEDLLTKRNAAIAGGAGAVLVVLSQLGGDDPPPRPLYPRRR